MLPTISVGSLGGTICMSSKGQEGGVKPTFSADDLVKAVPNLDTMCKIKTKNIRSVGSGSLQISDIYETYEWALSQVQSGSKAVIITQGTDTLEETSFLLNLIWKEPEPLIVVGAMRNPDKISSDGAGNIYSAIITALEPESRGRGVLVVMNDVIISAKFAHKSNTMSVQTFIGVNGGFEGVIAEGKARYIRDKFSRMVFEFDTNNIKNVDIITSYLGDNATLLRAASSFSDGIVINGFGAGVVSKVMMDGVKNIASNLPIIIAHRPESGISGYNTYGYYGAEISLIEAGCIMSGWLDAVKSRLLLITLLSKNMDKDGIREVFLHY